MPFAGLGLHILLALFCAYHVVRSGQQLYWLFILFAFPLLGSLVYLFAVYLPNSRLERGAMRAVSAAARALDPTREVREARARLEETPTAQNQMRLAAALLDNEQAEEAAKLYEACLKGPFASDLEIKFGAARAFTECQRYPEALAHLADIRQRDAGFRRDQVALLTARCLAGTARASEARSEFENAVTTHGTFEAYAEYMIWTLAIGDASTAARLQTELDKITQRWNKMARELNEPIMRRLRAAQQLAQKSA
ncbi:hypothetical protein LRH25_03085 [Ideonella azotifigens]|uniref:Tetratricopeptide repeat protein n=1 Tax=Ideonella azotifigens TaxID=513160 RepID=A0ABN1KJY5_9BURK|nr:hypothetical protein [Ideonella azotifigens]MCD2339319.1 hypothetical protein [Ideonella azotifigens]